MRGARLTIAGIVCLALILITLPVWSGCRQREPEPKPEPVYLKPSGEPVNLVNNSAAHDHPWQKVLKFLQEDTTDKERYTPERGSAYFAEMLHNRAEYYNFKTAFVVVEFENGESHALNAFNTVDYGLVYVDCTGEGALGRAPPDIVLDYEIPEALEQQCQKWEFDTIVVKYPPHTCWDKVAFVEQGERLNFVSVDCETLQFDYEWYTKIVEPVFEFDVLWEELRLMVDSHEKRSETLFNLREGVWSPERKCGTVFREAEGIKECIALALATAEIMLPYYWQESESPVAHVEIHW